MLYPRASICIIDLTDAELNALAEGIEQERHRREIQRRAEILVAEEKSRDKGMDEPPPSPVLSQRQVESKLRREAGLGQAATPPM